ncbi:MAG: MotA/TolQ/ExbB proton channel family protein [Planctomycetota bacterium]|nr:MotA/TolQ/ExbB proton channel family protein [Planctomycetota bacterium]
MPHPSTLLDAGQGDPECMIGLSSNRFTAASGLLWLVFASTLTAVCIGLSIALPSVQMSIFMNRCWTNWACVLAFLWCIFMLTEKVIKVRIQRRALEAVDLLPRRADFVLSPGTAPEIMERIRNQAARPREFLLFNRMWSSLSNLGNLGEVRDVGAVLEGLADSDASGVDSSYTTIKILIWTIPVYGFIGTVIGLGQAIGNFQNVINAEENAGSIRDNLTPVIGGLATAFETTLIALVLAVIVQLYCTWVYHKEESLLGDIDRYCHEHIISRLRLIDPR